MYDRIAIPKAGTVRPVGLLETTGALVASGLAWIGTATLFALRCIPKAFQRPFEIHETLRQLHQVGWQSMPLITAAGFAVGAVMSMHTRSSLERFGAESMIPAGVALALIRETGPLVTGLLVAGRVGASIGAELGSMRISEQIDALEALAVDSYKYLVVTRVIACVLALPLLTTLANFSGIVGGFLAETTVSGMTLSLYFDRAFSIVSFSDYIPATLKTMVFGFIIGTISAFFGFNATGGTEGVGRASTRSVVLSSIVLILGNVLLVRLIFFLFPEAG
ncbi:MAG: MlaE family ABC transporter permease [Acidobacteriota bacterium]